MEHWACNQKVVGSSHGLDKMSCYHCFEWTSCQILVKKREVLIMTSRDTARVTMPETLINPSQSCYENLKERLTEFKDARRKRRGWENQYRELDDTLNTITFLKNIISQRFLWNITPPKLLPISSLKIKMRKGPTLHLYQRGNFHTNVNNTQKIWEDKTASKALEPWC